MGFVVLKAREEMMMIFFFLKKNVQIKDRKKSQNTRHTHKKALRTRDGGFTTGGGPCSTTREDRSERRRGRADVRDDVRGVSGRVCGAIDRINRASEATARFAHAQ